MNIPSLPENFLKSIFVISLLAFSYIFYKNLENFDKEKELVNQFNSISDTIETIKISNDFQNQKLLWETNLLAFKHNIKNPIEDADSLIYFNLSGTSKDMPLIDTFSRLYWSSKQSLNNYKVDLILLQGKQRAIDEAITMVRDMDKEFQIAKLVFAFVIGVCVAALWHRQKIDDKIQLRQLNEKPMYFSCCQSCGKDFSALVVKGTNTNGTINTGFCNNCYTNGEFVSKCEKVENFIDEVLGQELTRYNIKKRNKIIKKIRKLDRWKNSY